MMGIGKKIRSLGGWVKNTIRYLVQFYRNLSIRYKLIVIIGVVVCAPFFTLTYLNYKSSETLLRENATQYSYDVLKMIELRFEDHIQALNSILQNTVYDERIYIPLQKDSLTTEDIQKIQHNLDILIQTQPAVQSVCIYTNRGGDYIYTDSPAAKRSISDILPPGSSQFNTVRRAATTANGLPSWYIDQESSACNILYSCAIYNKTRNHSIGFMVLLVNSDYFSAPFQNVKNKSMQNIAVLSNKDVVILSRSGTDMKLLTQKDIDQMGVDGWTIDEQHQVMFTYTQMVNPAWKVVSFVELPVLYEDITNLRRNYLFFCLIFTCVIVFLTYLVLCDFRTAFHSLLAGMKKIQNGTKNVHIDLQRKDEIGYMGEAFNAMSHEISVLEDWGYHEQLTRKEAEIRSLQAQINPHFLFNTLESINWIAQIENVPRISEITTSLATLLEGNMAKDESLVPFRKELEYIDSYMLIMEYRFENRITLTRDIDPAVMEVEIPRLLVQPIVENAVKHGLENVRRDGTIRLSAKVVGRKVCVVVEDNGVGIPPEKLEQLNRQLCRNDSSYYREIQSKSVGGIGLENVNRRIQLFYGPTYGLYIESKQGVFTRITFSIPYPGT